MQMADPMELNFEGLEIQKWNIPTVKARRVDEKNGVICLVNLFTYIVTVIKTSHFFADDSKESLIVWAKCLSA